MPTPDEILATGANIISPDQAQLDELSRRAAGSDLTTTLTDIINAANGNAMSPSQLSDAVNTPMTGLNTSTNQAVDALISGREQFTAASVDPFADARAASMAAFPPKDFSGSAGVPRRLNPENKRAVASAPDFVQQSMEQVMRMPVADRPQWFHDVTAGSSAEARRGEQGLAAFAENLRSQYQPDSPDMVSPVEPSDAPNNFVDDAIDVEGTGSAVGFEGFKGNIRANFEKSAKSQSGRFAFGYGVMQMGESGGQDYKVQNSGNYLTPEQTTTANASLLPGIGTAVGAIAGAAFGNPIVGSMAGGAIGGIAQGVIGAADERNQASRQIGDQFAAALGEATAKVRDFSAAADATGAPLKQLQQVLGTVGGTAPLGADAIAGAGAMTNALGEFAGGNYSSVSRQVRDPALFGMAVSLGENGRLSRGQYQSLGTIAAINGDAEGLQQDDLGAQRATLADNPKYQAAQQKMRDAESAGGIAVDAVTAVMGGGVIPLAQRGLAALTGYRQSKGFEENVGDDPTAKERAEIFKQFGTLRASQSLYGATAGAEEAGREGVSLRGGSAEDIAGASVGAKAALSAQSANYGENINVLQGLLAKSKDPAESLRIRTEIERDAQGQQNAQNQSTQLDQQNKASLFSQRESAYGLQEAGGENSLVSGLYGGRSFAQLRGAQDSLLSNEGARAAQLQRDAYNPLNSPAERDSMLANATALGTQQVQQSYQFAQNLYGEENRSLDITRAQRQGDLSRAEVFGTPQDAYNAGIKNIQTDRDQLNQNNSELQRGNLTFAQRQQITRQNVDIQTDIDTGPEKARINAYDSEISILGNNQAANRAGLSRAVSIGGADAFTAQTFTDDQNNIGIAKAARDGSPVGSAQYAKFNRQYQDSVVQQQEDFTASVTFRETAAERTTGAELAGEQFRANRIGGVGAQDAALRQVGRDAGLISELNGKRYDTNDALGREANTRARQGYEDDMAEQVTRSQTYSETVQDRTRDSNINSAFRRAMKNPYQDGDSESNPFTRGEASLSNLRGELTQAQSALSKSTDPNAILANTERVNSFKDQITDIEAMRRTAMLGALPEFIGGAGGRGVMSGVLPTDGQSSFYNSNPYITGSFGKPNIAGDSGGHVQAPGGMAGNFLAATGHAASGGADANTAILSQIRDLLQRGSTPGGRSPAMPSPSGFSQNNNLYTNTQRSYVDLH